MDPDLWTATSTFFVEVGEVHFVQRGLHGGRGRCTLLDVVDGGGGSGHSLIHQLDGRPGKTGTALAAGIVNAFTQRLQAVHVHNRSGDRDDDAHHGAHQAAGSAQFHLLRI